MLVPEPNLQKILDPDPTPTEITGSEFTPLENTRSVSDPTKDTGPLRHDSFKKPNKDLITAKKGEEKLYFHPNV